MRLGEALVCAFATIAIFPAAPARADDAPLPPLDVARPPPPPEPEPRSIPWEHHVEVGAGLAVSEMPASVDGDGKPTPIRFRTGPGFHIDLSSQIHRFLRMSGYLVEHENALELPAGALGLAGTLQGPSSHTYVFGLRFSPTLPIGPRARIWLTAGAGWGRIGYGRFTFTETGQSAVTLRDRTESLVEIPLGVGGLFEIIPRWLSVHVEVTGAFVPSQVGDALEHGQYIDAAGKMRDLAPMPRLDASFVETIGLSLHL